MRVFRPSLVLLFVTACVLTGAVVLGSPAPSAAAIAASLTVTPDHGRPTTTFIAEYRYPTTTTRCGTVQFQWDGSALGRPVSSVRTNGGCIARVRARPPDQDRAPGPHEVSAASAEAAIMSATFTIDGATPTDSASIPLGSDPAIVTQPSRDTSGLVGANKDPQSGSGGWATTWILVIGGMLVLAGAGIFGLLFYLMRKGDGDDGTEPDSIA